MAIFGYARVSSIGQPLDVQTSELTDYGCVRIYKEKRSGTTVDRKELKSVLGYVRDGDIFVITKLDRLARSTFHLTQIVDGLKQKGVEFVVIDQNIDTITPTGKLLFNVLASIAEFETEIRKECQIEGIQKAKQRGVKFGAKSKLPDDQVQEMSSKRVEGVLIKDLMAEYSLSKASVYRLLK